MTKAKKKPLIEEASIDEINAALPPAPEKEPPVLTAIGVVKRGANRYVAYKIKTQGDKVLSIEAEEENMKSIAMDSLKIMCVKNFFDME